MKIYSCSFVPFNQDGLAQSVIDDFACTVTPDVSDTTVFIVEAAPGTALRQGEWNVQVRSCYEYSITSGDLFCTDTQTLANKVIIDDDLGTSIVRCLRLILIHYESLRQQGVGDLGPHMLQVNEDGQDVDDQVATNRANTCKQGADVWDVKCTNQGEDIDTQGYGKTDHLWRFLSSEEESEDQIVEEVSDEWVRREEQEEDGETAGVLLSSAAHLG